MHSWGIRTLLLTNAAGGINKKFLTGDLMLIADPRTGIVGLFFLFLGLGSPYNPLKTKQGTLFYS